MVLLWLIGGESEFDIAKTIKEWPESIKERAEIMEAVQEKLIDSADVDPSLVKGWCLLSMRDIYKKLIDSGDYVNAIKAIKEYKAIADR